MQHITYVQWHVTKCRDCFAAYWTYHFSIQTPRLITPVSHINLSRILPYTVVLMWAWTMINMPLPSCDKILQIFLPAYLQLQSPYYFRKVVWSLSLDYSIPCSTSNVPRVPFSFKMCFFFLYKWNMEMCFSSCVDDVSLYHITISSTSH